MQPDKTWEPEDVLRLAATVLFCLVTGMLLIAAVGQFLPNLSKANQNFIAFGIGMCSFQGATLVLVHLFIRERLLTWRTAFGVAWEQGGRVARLVVPAMLLVLPATLALGKGSEMVLLWFGIKPAVQDAVKMLQAGPPLGHLLGYGVGAMLLAPVAEEVIFRGILYPTLKRSGYPRLGLWATSLLFAAIHANLLAFVPMTFLALVMVWFYERTGNLLAPILAHVLFNSVNFTFLVTAPSWLKTN